MNYAIKIADHNNPDVDLAIRNLFKVTYDSNDLFPEKFLANNINSLASKPSFLLIAEEDNKIIGCNAFLANDFSLDGINYVGYQSCWTVTHPDHQGKKIFTSMINDAKKILKDRGAGFIYGIANNRSNPILTKKLGFSETAAIFLRIPRLPFYRQLYFGKGSVPCNQDGILINEEQVKEHKLMQSPTAVKVIRYNDSWLWGKLIRKKKWGFRIPVFYVGGVQLATGTDLKGLVSGIFRTHKACFIQFVSCKSNTFNGMLKGWKPAKMNGFVFYNLSMPDFEHFNLMIGPFDFF